MLSRLDRLLVAADSALQTLLATPRSARPHPDSDSPRAELSTEERAYSAALMRVNHVGEICAQAMYTAQAACTSNPALRRHLEHAAAEETDHLAWTARRLTELGARPSLLNPLWYAGAFGIGALAARLGDRVSLGFVAETEKQVEAHLQSHLGLLPARDQASRAIVARMKEDEVRHGREAQAAGARELPFPARAAMRLAAKLMTTVAQRI